MKVTRHQGKYTTDERNLIQDAWLNNGSSWDLIYSKRGPFYVQAVQAVKKANELAKALLPA